MLSSIGKDIVHTAQSTIKHVRDILWESTEPESTPSLPQSLPPESSCQPEQSAVTHANPNARPTASASMKSSSQLKRNIVDRLIEGTFDSGVEISDDDDDDVQEISPPRPNTRTTADVSKSNKSPRVTRAGAGAGQQISALGEEQQLSKTPSPYFQDSHVINKSALRTTRRMPYGRASNNFTATGGLRPFDTLKQPSVLSKKNEYYLSNTRPRSDRSGLSITQAHPRPKPTPQSVEDESPPPKRRRIDPSVVKGDNSAPDKANSRSRSEDADFVDPAVSEPSLASAYGVDDLETHGTRQNAVRATALRNINLKHPTAKGNRRSIRSNSPIDILNINNGDHEEESFMRGARRERECRIFDSDEEHGDRGDHDKSAITRSYKVQSPTTNGDGSIQVPKSNRSVTQTITPRISKMSSRLQESSPDVLHSSAQTSAKPLRKFASPSRSPPISSRTGKIFPLKRFICGALPVAEAKAYEIEVDEESRVFSVHYSDPDLMKDAIAGPIAVSKIIKIAFPSDEDANLIILNFSSGVLLGHQCSLDFGNSRKTLTEFFSKILGIDSSIRQTHRSSDWIIRSAMGATNANSKETKHAHAAQDEEIKESSRQATVAFHAPKRSADSQGIFRERKVDQLDSRPANQTPHGTENGKMPGKISPTNNQHDSRPSQLTPAPPVGRLRETRSKVLKEPQEVVGRDTISLDVEPRRKGNVWKRPLIYPTTGKSRATVTWDDLERLNDDEFLNDNLVALFMRYLQEHMNQEHAKTMHFFSTFFYNALTRPAERGKSRQINYSAVANWTKTVNLFKRDYVIVPVNEAAHWYVMIICNLQSLREPQVVGKDEDVVEITEPVEEDGNLAEDALKMILESDIAAEKDFSDDSDYAENSSISKSTSAKKRLSKQKQLRRRKYSTDQPIIITLDSLDQARSGTASALKSYLIEEAKDKYDLIVDKNDIKGMTAKNIPLQGNFSDCGLYLCMYLEQFVRDPTLFIRSILQREEKTFPWPRKLQNGVLRQRLYDMIQELHRAQVKKTTVELPQIGRLLIKDEDYRTGRKTVQSDIYEPGNVKAGVDYYERHESRDDKVSPVDRMLLEEVLPHQDENLIRGPGQQTTRTAGTRGTTSQPIVVEDSQADHQTQDDTLSRYFQPRKDESDISEATQRPDTPQALAERLRKARSPGKGIIEAHTVANTTIDLTTPVRQTRLDDNLPTDETDKRTARSQSCTTDFLTSDATYKNDDRNEPLQRSDGSTYNYGHDHRMQNVEDDFTVFSDEGPRSRDCSVVPESVQNEQSPKQSQDQMLLD